jgi:cell fate (sporulation/competence/biofilm development) regulator YlbF (YheA/YmcA/DUF963 family)
MAMDRSIKHWFAFASGVCCIKALARLKKAGNVGAGEQKTKLIMEATIAENSVVQKTKELCQAILDEPSMRNIRQRIDAFMGDERAKAQYDGLMTKGQALQQKQQMSLPLTGEEISDFEQHRDELLNNPVARGFLDAQEELNQVQQSVHQYVNKTLELGRLPTEEELGGGSCGHGCGCHH